VGDRRAIMAALERRVEQAVVAVAVNATEELTSDTPVDTGFARSNWTPAVGSPPERTDDGAQARGLAEIVRYRLEDGSAFVSNHAEYIQRLDAGHSQQAPAGFVRQAVARAVDRAAKEAG
jgi:hypothetical protein